MRQTVIGIFNNKSDAESAITQLEYNGISRTNIDLSTSGTADNTDRNYREKEENTDGISRFFNSLFDSNDEADKYSNVAKHNDCVLTVHAESSEEAMRAAEVMDTYGAVDVEEHASRYGDSKLGRHLTDTERESESIPVIEEHMEVGKKEVETGRTQLRSRIIERPVEERMRLREEHVHVERNPVNRPATEAELNNFLETEMEVTEHKEVPVVSKEARVVEEVRLEKDVEEREETIQGSVRKTEVDVDSEDLDSPEYRNRDYRTTDDTDIDRDSDYRDTDRDTDDRF